MLISDTVLFFFECNGTAKCPQPIEVTGATILSHEKSQQVTPIYSKCCKCLNKFKMLISWYLWFMINIKVKLCIVQQALQSCVGREEHHSELDWRNLFLFSYKEIYSCHDFGVW